MITCAMHQWTFQGLKHQYNNRRRCAAKIMIEFGGVFVMLKVSRKSEVVLHAFVTSKRHSCGSWELVIYLNLIDSFSMVENTPQPEWTHPVRSFWRPKIMHEAMECRRLADNQDHMLMYMTSLSVGPPLVLDSNHLSTGQVSEIIQVPMFLTVV